ncbi:hypothetical protein WMY93_000325 [Mugilogobius chulae]|uniref:Uncharacterized protein n=1 Tax=Mugilogobius chulae TaxID=88201 RepID=A0AAW0Q1Z3_9GOBI
MKREKEAIGGEREKDRESGERKRGERVREKKVRERREKGREEGGEIEGERKIEERESKERRERARNKKSQKLLNETRRWSRGANGRLNTAKTQLVQTLKPIGRQEANLPMLTPTLIPTPTQGPVMAKGKNNHPLLSLSEVDQRKKRVPSASV